MEDGRCYIERSVISNEKIYVKGHQDLDIMKVDKIPKQTCTNVPEHSGITMNKLIETMVHPYGLVLGNIPSASSSKLNEKTEIKTRTCVSNKRNYIELKHRTKTLDDIRVENDTKNMEQVTPLVNSYEKAEKGIRQPIRLESKQE